MTGDGINELKKEKEKNFLILLARPFILGFS